MADFLTIAHECKDFAVWRHTSDADSPNRKEAGLTDLALARGQDNANLIGLIMGVSDRAKAVAFGTSETLRETMASAGIIGTPTVTLREGDFTPAPAGAKVLTLNCTISGVDKFRAGYAMDKADREAATLTDLGLLTAVDDPHNLFLIWSYTDEAKLKAFMASPDLAKHQVDNAGVTSAPILRFWTS
jgi:hypothetical protein